MTLTNDQLTSLEHMYWSNSFEVFAKIRDLAEWLERRATERRQVAYGLEHEGMGAAALAVNAQSGAYEDSLHELIRLMKGDCKGIQEHTNPETGAGGDSCASGSVEAQQAS